MEFCIVAFMVIREVMNDCLDGSSWFPAIWLIMFNFALSSALTKSSCMPVLIFCSVSWFWSYFLEQAYLQFVGRLALTTLFCAISTVKMAITAITVVHLACI